MYDGACFQCEYDTHVCHFCGTELDHQSYSYLYSKEAGETVRERHWLSDCRPDLVEHELGPTCTWWYKMEMTDMYEQPVDPRQLCYGFQEKFLGGDKGWSSEHIHFFEDWPMT